MTVGPINFISTKNTIEQVNVAVKSAVYPWALQILTDAQDVFPAQKDKFLEAFGACVEYNFVEMTKILDSIPDELAPSEKPKPPSATNSNPGSSRRKPSTPTRAVPKGGDIPFLNRGAVKSAAVAMPKLSVKPAASSRQNADLKRKNEEMRQKYEEEIQTLNGKITELQESRDFFIRQLQVLDEAESQTSKKKKNPLKPQQ